MSAGLNSSRAVINKLASAANDAVKLGAGGQPTQLAAYLVIDILFRAILALAVDPNYLSKGAGAAGAGAGGGVDLKVVARAFRYAADSRVAEKLFTPDEIKLFSQMSQELEEADNPEAIRRDPAVAAAIQRGAEILARRARQALAAAARWGVEDGQARASVSDPKRGGLPFRLKGDDLLKDAMAASFATGVEPVVPKLSEGELAAQALKPGEGPPDERVIALLKSELLPQMSDEELLRAVIDAGLSDLPGAPGTAGGKRKRGRPRKDRSASPASAAAGATSPATPAEPPLAERTFPQPEPGATPPVAEAAAPAPAPAQGPAPVPAAPASDAETREWILTEFKRMATGSARIWPTSANFTAARLPGDFVKAVAQARADGRLPPEVFESLVEAGSDGERDPRRAFDKIEKLIVRSQPKAKPAKPAAALAPLVRKKAPAAASAPALPEAVAEAPIPAPAAASPGGVQGLDWDEEEPTERGGEADEVGQSPNLPTMRCLGLGSLPGPTQVMVHAARARKAGLRGLPGAPTRQPGWLAGVFDSTRLGLGDIFD